MVDTTNRMSLWGVDESEFPVDGPFEAQARFLLQYAVLAPSSHNSQPWAFSIGDGEIAVFADESRWLTVADADKRELSLSVGCALENLLVAAAHFGFESTVADATDGDDELVATVVLEPADRQSERGALFDAIPKRYTNHHPYSDRQIPDGVLDRMRDIPVDADVSVQFVTDEETISSVGELQARADEHQFEDPAYRRELGHWIGTGALGASWIAARIGQVAVTYLDLGEREGKKNSTLFENTPVLALFTSDRDDRRSQVDVGRAFEHLSLVATDAGVSVHPVSQILEVPEFKRALSERLGIDDSTPQHLVRLGYTDAEEAHTPRRPLDDVLR